jgi:hypothetical protein
MARLIIKCGDLPAEAIELNRGLNRLGRSATNDFQIQHASVSRCHCEVEVTDDAMFVRDLDSSNGTYVNGQPVERVQIQTGQIIRIGDVEMEVRDAPEPVEQGEFVPCVNHAKHPASMECLQCHKKYCGSCVHILQRTGGDILRLCPTCSGHCVPLEGLNQGKKTFLGGIVDKLLMKKTQESKYRY